MNADTLTLACVIAGDEHIQRTTRGQDVAKECVERLDDIGACGGGFGDQFRDGGVVRDGQPGDPGVEGVGDVDDDLAGQRVPVLADGRHGAVEKHCEDDDVAGWGGAPGPGRGAGAERAGKGCGLGRIATYDFDGVAALEGQGADGAVFPEPMMLMLLMMCSFLPAGSLARSIGLRRYCVWVRSSQGCMPTRPARCLCIWTPEGSGRHQMVTSAILPSASRRM